MTNWTVKIRKAGGSKAITLPSNLLKEAKWDIGEVLILTIISDNCIMLHAKHGPRLAPSVKLVGTSLDVRLSQ